MSEAMLAEQQPQDDRHCFGCGPENASGLQLRFSPVGDGSVRSETVLREEFQGWQGVAHGGIVTMLLDEAMAHAAFAAGHLAVTANIRVRFKRPTPLQQPLVLQASLVWQRAAVLGMKADLRDESGRVLALAEGEFLARRSATGANVAS